MKKTSLYICIFICILVLNNKVIFAEQEYSFQEVQIHLLTAESDLRTKVKKGPSYIRQLGPILGALQSNTEQFEKIYERMQMLKSPEKFEKMSQSAQILIDYIYYKILFLEQESTLSEKQIQTTQNPNQTTLKTLKDFPKADDTWRERLKVNISQMGFSTLYFNTENGSVSHPITLKDMSFSGTGVLQDIAPFQDAGVYMGGYLDIASSGQYDFHLTHSGGDAQLLLDNTLIFEGDQAGDISLYLEAGKHLLELQYVNNTDTLEVEVKIGE